MSHRSRAALVVDVCFRFSELGTMKLFRRDIRTA